MQKTAYELRNSDWSSDVCSSDLRVNTGIDYVLCEADLRAGRIANLSQCNRSISVLRRSGGNPNLKPEESESWSFGAVFRSEEHTSELQSLLRISYAVFCMKKKPQ